MSAVDETLPPGACLIFAVAADGRSVVGAAQDLADSAERLGLWDEGGALVRDEDGNPLWRALREARKAWAMGRQSQVRRLRIAVGDDVSEIDLVAMPNDADVSPSFMLIVHFRVGVVERLQSRYHLTRAEAEVATALADGQDPAEIARDRGVTLATTRSQLKSALAKTGLRRQAQLVALAAKLWVGG